MARKTKKDWLEEGFVILSEFAQDKLRMQYLCERLGLTRGSFYHHFASMEEYTTALMELWEEQNTADIIVMADKGITAEEQMELLVQHIWQLDQTLEAAIRSWAFYHPIVKKHLEKVDERRINYSAKLFKAMGKSTSVAKKLARIEYATLIGLQQLYPNINGRELKALYKVHMTKR